MHPRQKQQSFDTTDYESYRITQREQRLYVQKKTFTKWMNSFLLKAGTQVEDIFVDLSDGRKLLKLLEIISGVRLGKPAAGQMRIHSLENVNKCLKYLLTEERLKIENISAEDIVDCNQKLILGLLWLIILRFQIKDIQVNFSDDDDEEEDIKKGDDIDGGAKSHNIEENTKPKHSPKEALLLWCQKRTKRYEHVHVVDFGESWRNGMAFNALIHSHRPDLIDYNALNPDNHIENLNHAFDVARDHLDIQPLLDAEDVDTEKPDEPSILTYVSSFYHTIAPSDNAPANPPEPKQQPVLEPEEPEINEEEIVPMVKSVTELQVEASPSEEEEEIPEPEKVAEQALVPSSEAAPKEDSFFIWVIVVAVGFTILRSVFHDTTNWFSNFRFNRL